MTSRHWTGVFVALFFVLWLSMCSYSDAQERLFNPDAEAEAEAAAEIENQVIMEAYRALDYPSRAAFGEGLILRYEGRVAFHGVQNGPLRNEICGVPLGCIEWTAVEGAELEVCTIHYELGLPPVVMDVLMPRLIADCGITQ